MRAATFLLSLLYMVQSNVFQLSLQSHSIQLHATTMEKTYIHLQELIRSPFQKGSVCLCQGYYGYQVEDKLSDLREITQKFLAVRDVLKFVFFVSTIRIPDLVLRFYKRSCKLACGCYAFDACFLQEADRHGGASLVDNSDVVLEPVPY